MIYYTDVCTLINHTEDSRGSIQTTTRENVPCRFYDNDLLITGSDGNTYRYRGAVYMSANISVNEGDEVIITKMNGVAMDYPKKKIKQVKLGRLMSFQRKEVFLG